MKTIKKGGRLPAGKQEKGAEKGDVLNKKKGTSLISGGKGGQWQVREKVIPIGRTCLSKGYWHAGRQLAPFRKLVNKPAHRSWSVGGLISVPFLFVHRSWSVGGLMSVSFLFLFFCSSLYAAAGGFVYQAAPRIITPANADGRNDVFFVFYRNLDSQSSLSGKIFNLMGMKVADMVNTGGIGVILSAPAGGWHPGLTASWEGYLKWTPSGSIPQGIYIWQVEAEGQVYTGMVIVAK
ncbi:MAG: hypothetical protein COS41_01645 [Elusimicrobia bacterium CG03_land_8_20_14_0_80_50_18]|nr:MAG: hypothetical protein COS41_01645 [Elusimicrobia bacterium CG03_land_8_20_14_0_80_50_18]